MNEETNATSIGRYIVAGIVLVIGAWFLLHLVIGLVVAVASALVVVLAVVAVIWALRVLL
jgi:hypothetical protein